MKIGIVCYPTFGGSGVLATELAKQLALNGHEVHIISYSHPVRLSLLQKNIYYHEVNIQEYPLFMHQPYVIALTSTLYEVVKNHKLDLIHAHYAIPHAFAAFNAKKMLDNEGITLPIVTTLHGTDITLVGKHPSYKSSVTFSINQSDKVTTVSHSLKEDTLSTFDIKKEIYVIHNFLYIDESDISQIKCDRSSIAKENEKIILHVSNFRKVKRVNDVIQIFARILNCLDSVLIMVGEGPEKEMAEELSNKLGVRNKIRFLGNSVDLYKIYCYADLLLLPSEKESFGLVALEAMAFGTPVISTNTGGLPEVNKHNFSGYLANVGDISQMSEKAIMLLNDNELLDKMKIQSRIQSQKFDKKRIVKQYELIYLDCLR